LPFTVIWYDILPHHYALAECTIGLCSSASDTGHMDGNPLRLG
jgi:hypothetical protein